MRRTGVERTGLEAPPRIRPASVAAGAGLLWGAFSYSILWEGSPFPVDRAFVESLRGTIVLLPARIALWGMHAAEAISGRTFELSRSTWILALAAGISGLAVGLLVAVVVMGFYRLLRR